MMSLLVQSAQILLPIDLSSLTSRPKITDQEFYALCRTNPELRIERNADGEVIVMPPAFADNGNRNGRILGQLYIWSEMDGSGEVFDSSSGFTLPNGAVRSPDAAWILFDRWHALPPEQQASFAPIVPDFVVELRSSSDALVNLKQKMEEYILCGVRLGVLIDRSNRQVHLYRPERTPEILDEPESIRCAPEMPGFELRMAGIW